MKILVCGGRDYSDANRVSHFLTQLQPTEVMHGGAHGADRLANNWAKQHGVPAASYYAEWARYGRAAGPRRNQEMLDIGRPDVVLAFPGGRGTADMVRRAKAAGVATIEVT